MVIGVTHNVHRAVKVHVRKARATVTPVTLVTMVISVGLHVHMAVRMGAVNQMDTVTMDAGRIMLQSVHGVVICSVM